MMLVNKNYIKYFIFTMLLSIGYGFSSCKSDAKESTETTTAPTEQQHTDSLIKSDKARADSMLNALKEKMK